MRSIGCLVVLIGMSVAWGPLSDSRLQACQVDSAIELSGMTVSEVAEVTDPLPIDWQTETMIRLWYRSLRQPAIEFERAAQLNDRPQVRYWSEGPQEVRMRVYRVSGRLVRLEPIQLVDHTELGATHVAEIILDSGERVFAGVLAVPRLLPIAQELDQPVSVCGFFAGWAAEVDGQRVALMVAPKLSWFPRQRTQNIPLRPGHLSLATAGFDLGLLDIPRKFNRLAFQADDTWAFSELLRTIAKSPVTALEGEAPSTASGLLPILQAPDDAIGQLVEFDAQVHRVTPIDYQLADVANTPIRYYQLDLFVSIGKTSIRMRNAQGEELVFQNRFPVTVNAVRLPDSVVNGEDRQVRVRGFYYRLWSYESTMSAGKGGQFTPLVFSSSVLPIAVDTATLDVWISGLFLSLFAAIGLLVWFLRK